MSDILLSVCCITFNHEKFIKSAIDSFLMQKTTFKIEIIIHDDASTDKTADIIKEYEARHPDVIVPIIQTENQYSKKKSGMMARFVFPRARGKYLALCEGDDYWTDPYKLQKQVDFLEANEAYNLCAGGIRYYYEDTKEEKEEIAIPSHIVANKEGYTFSLYDTKKVWLTRTLTVVFRNDKDRINNHPKYKYGRDVHLMYHLLKNGKAFYFTEIFGVYRVHSGGIESGQTKKGLRNNGYNIYKELYFYNKEEFIRYNLYRNILGLLHFNLNNKREPNGFFRNLKLFSEAASILNSFSELRAMLYCFIPDGLINVFRRVKHSRITTVGIIKPVHFIRAAINKTKK